MRHIEQSLRAVASLDVDEATKGTILMAVDDYTIGHTIRARVRKARTDRRSKALELHPEVEAALAAGDLPALAGPIAARGARPGAGLPPEADFERGLEWLLDGIEAEVTSAAPMAR
jgi:hypothetical protein